MAAGVPIGTAALLDPLARRESIPDRPAQDIAAVPAGQLAGIVCLRGSTLSHTAVMARALGIPAVVSLAPLPVGRLDGCEEAGVSTSRQTAVFERRGSANRRQPA